jgi:hypothetical protein
VLQITILHQVINGIFIGLGFIEELNSSDAVTKKKQIIND